MDREILRLAVPSIVSNVTVPLLSLVDLAIVGHIGDAVYLAAISVGAMVFNVVYWVLGFLRMGTSGLVAQAWGRGDCVEVNRLFSRGLLTGVGMGLVLLVLALPLRWVAFWLMRVSVASEGLVGCYFDVCIFGAPAVLGGFALNGFLIGVQDARTPMWVAICQNVVNIVLSLVLVFWLDLGIRGVALGTVGAQWLAFVLLLLAARRGHGSLARVRLDVCDVGWGRFFAVNGDIFLRTLCLVAVNFFFTSAGSAQGEVVLAVNSLIMTLFTVFSYVMDGFAFAGEALGGRFAGGGDARSLLRLHGRLLVWGACCALCFSVVYAFGGAGFLGLLTSDGEVLALAGEYSVLAPLIPLCGVGAFVYDGLFIGMTRTKEMFLSCLLGAGVFFGLYFVLFPLMGNFGLWTALLCYLLLRGAVLGCLWWLRPRARIYNNKV